MTIIILLLGISAAGIILAEWIKSTIKFNFSDTFDQLREVQAMDYKYLYGKIRKLEKRVADLEGKQQHNEKYFGWEAEAKNNNNQQ